MIRSIFNALNILMVIALNVTIIMHLTGSDLQPVMTPLYFLLCMEKLLIIDGIAMWLSCSARSIPPVWLYCVWGVEILAILTLTGLVCLPQQLINQYDRNRPHTIMKSGSNHLRAPSTAKEPEFMYGWSSESQTEEKKTTGCD